MNEKISRNLIAEQNTTALETYDSARYFLPGLPKNAIPYSREAAKKFLF